MVPPSILFIPLATVVFQLGLYDNPVALILTYPTFLIPFSTTGPSTVGRSNMPAADGDRSRPMKCWRATDASGGGHDSA